MGKKGAELGNKYLSKMVPHWTKKVRVWTKKRCGIGQQNFPEKKVQNWTKKGAKSETSRQLLGNYVRDRTRYEIKRDRTSSPVSDSTCVQTAAVDSTVQSTRLGGPYSRSFPKEWNFPLEFTIG